MRTKTELVFLILRFEGVEVFVSFCFLFYRLILEIFLLVCSTLFFKFHNSLNLVNSEKREFSILMHYIFEGVGEGKMPRVS